MLNEISIRIVSFLCRDVESHCFVGGLVGEGVPLHTIRDNVRDYLLSIWDEDPTMMGATIGHKWETVATILADTRAEAHRVVLDELVDLEAVSEALIWESHKYDGEV